jgi:glycosyltransferase involved in cell wall biosynthesis
VDGAASGASGDRYCQDAFDRVFDVSWSRHPLSWTNFFRAPRQIRSIVTAGEYDLVHVHTPVAGFVVRWALRKTRKTGAPAIIYTAHGFHFHPRGSKLRNFFYRRLEQIAARWTDYLIVINRTDEEMARKYRLISADRLVYMPGIGIDLDAYDPHTVDQESLVAARRELGLETSDKLFLMIAEFVPNKRHVDVLHAVSDLADARIHVAFAGEGPLKNEIAKLAAKLEITSQIHFLGYREDISTLICASVATLLVSEREGLPRCVMESLSLAVPVVVSDIRGNRELVTKGGGLLIPPRNRQALAGAIRELAESPRLVENLAQTARWEIVSYDLSKLLNLHEHLYSRATKTDFRGLDEFVEATRKQF